MTLPTSNGYQIAMVDVKKKSAFGFRIVSGNKLGYTERGKGGYNWIEHELPSKGYKVMGRPEHIQEEQAAEIVDSEYVRLLGAGTAIRYKDYQYGSIKFFSALTSLDSLIRANGKEPGEIVIVYKKL